MTEQKDNSSLPLLLVISGAVLLTAVAGWFLLDPGGPVPGDNTTPALSQSLETEESEAGLAEIDIDSELRKARLAADADILVFPSEQSALHFYGRIVKADPNHAIANAEFDTVLSRISQIVTSHLAAAEYDDAYRIAVRVAGQKPDHLLVEEMQQTLNDLTVRLVEQAIQHTQNGNDEDATTALAQAEALPGLNPQYFTAVHDSIAEIRQSRLTAEQEQLQTAELAVTQAQDEWIQNVRSAIEAGQLISPADENARDYLSQRGTWDSDKEELTDELMEALIAAARNNIASNQLTDAELQLNAAYDLDTENIAVVELLEALENAFIEAETNKVLGLSDLVQLYSVPARYPRRAEERDVSGWVDVLFTVTPTGQTMDIEVARAEPQVIFNQSAIDAVEQWTFQPREFRGRRINQRVTVRLVFQFE